MKITHLFALVFLLSIGNAFAQTGIGTNLPDKSAELDVSSSNKGVLIPRVELQSKTDTTTITGNSYSESLIVYHTGRKDLLAGFYFWSANQWNALISNTTLNQYINEIAKEGNVTITTNDGKDFTFTWIDKTTKEEKNTTLGAIIKLLETKTAIKKTDSKGVEVAIDVKPTKIGFTFYEYENEDKSKFYISVSEDVNKDFVNIINDINNKQLLENLIKNTGGNASISKDVNGDIIITDINGTAPDNVYNISQLIKNNSAIAELKLVTDVAQNKDSVKAGFTFKDGKDVANNVSFAETLTKITKKPYLMYVYMDIDAVTGEMKEVHTETKRPNEDTNPPVNEYEVNKFVYENEKGDLIEIKGSDLFNSNSSSKGEVNMETLTSLRLDLDASGFGKSLVYLDERKQETKIPISDIFDQTEKITTLKVDDDKSTLIYTNETGIPNPIPLSQIAKQPWSIAKTTDQATKNGQDIYTQGWVGIGYDRPSEPAVPGEKLRVNGSITATNSYYADYVFESYFEGYSNLKYDYKFNDLNFVDSFIKTNRHLPGITPISDLEKTDTGYSFNVSALSIQLLEKTEELFLHVIDQQKELNAKEERIEKLESEMSEMSKRLQVLEGLLTK